MKRLELSVSEDVFKAVEAAAGRDGLPLGRYLGRLLGQVAAAEADGVAARVVHVEPEDLKTYRQMAIDFGWPDAEFDDIEERRWVSMAVAVTAQNYRKRTPAERAEGRQWLQEHGGRGM